MDQSTATVIIPSLDPNQHLLDLLKGCKKEGLHRILIVDDGSGAQFQPIFEEAERIGAVVLHHERNLGKGQAIKTAIAYCHRLYQADHIIVTADSDGQHLPHDIKHIKDVVLRHPDALILGGRDFDAKDIPLKSRLGNRATTLLMKVFCGFSIKDTQTGLRGCTLKLAVMLAQVEGDRFEYEFHMLFYCKEHHITIIEEPISTVYMDDNAHTHFHPLKDSLRIYRVFFRFLLSSFASSLLDILVFSVIISLMKAHTDAYIWWSTIIARFVSSIFNFTWNKRAVFHDQQSSLWVPIKYFTLCIIVMCLSASMVTILYETTKLTESICKIFVDLVLFVLSFVIQREFIFTGRKERL